MLLVLLGLHHYCIHHYTVTFAKRKGDGTPRRLRKSFTGERPTVTLPGLRPRTLTVGMIPMGAGYAWMYSNLTTDQYNELSDATMDAMLDSLEALVDESGQQEYEIEYNVRPVHFYMVVLHSLLAMPVVECIFTALTMQRLCSGM